MKTIFFIFASLGIITMMTAAVPVEELSSGFGGIDWATPLEAVKDCEKVAER